MFLHLAFHDAVDDEMHSYHFAKVEGLGDINVVHSAIDMAAMP